ncbi:CHIA (predicted) [Pycnogonum litorale]
MGFPPKKLAASYPAIARTFTLLDLKSNNVYAKVESRGDPGRYTFMYGRLSYFEMCYNIKKKDGWTKGYDYRGRYAYKRNQWATYYDVNSVIQLAKFIKEKGLAGSVVWNINDDDFRGSCCKNRKFKSPLQLAMMSELKGNNKTVEDVRKSCPY